MVRLVGFMSSKYSDAGTDVPLKWNGMYCHAKVASELSTPVHNVSNLSWIVFQKTTKCGMLQYHELWQDEVRLCNVKIPSIMFIYLVYAFTVEINSSCSEAVECKTELQNKTVNHCRSTSCKKREQTKLSEGKKLMY